VQVDEQRAMRDAVDAEVAEVLVEARRAVGALDPRAEVMVAELGRLHAAGGARMRGVLVWWGHRAGAGDDGAPIRRAAAAVELLHLMALVHDDVMDDADVRRGVASVHRSFADASGSAAAGRSLAVLTGDLAAVLADRALDGAGFAPDRLAAARSRYDEMRMAMAAGQYLDLTAGGPAEQVAALKGGSYSVEGPLVLGATLAGASDDVLAVLSAYGEPLGLAFQVRDDVRDGDARAGDVDLTVLGEQAIAALRGLPPEVTAALESFAREVTT
jgi:geranylgeranyl diphosphate synthase type I